MDDTSGEHILVHPSGRGSTPSLAPHVTVVCLSTCSFPRTQTTKTEWDDHYPPPVVSPQLCSPPFFTRTAASCLPFFCLLRVYHQSSTLDARFPLFTLLDVIFLCPPSPPPPPLQAGNEADVSLYVGASGLMWENAPEFRALLVFAEHRFYGESLPFGAPDKRREFLRQDRAAVDCVFASLVASATRWSRVLGLQLSFVAQPDRPRCKSVVGLPRCSRTCPSTRRTTRRGAGYGGHCGV